MAGYPDVQPRVAVAVDAGLDRTNGHPGLLSPTSRLWKPGSRLGTANQLMLTRVCPPRNMLIRYGSIIVITAATTDDPVEFVILDAALAKLATSGPVTGKVNVAGPQRTIFLTAPYGLKAGTVYYVGLGYGAVGGTAAAIRAADYGDSAGGQMFGTAPPAIDATFVNSAYGQAGPFTSGGPIATAHHIALME